MLFVRCQFTNGLARLPKGDPLGVGQQPDSAERIETEHAVLVVPIIDNDQVDFAKAEGRRSGPGGGDRKNSAKNVTEDRPTR